LGTTPRVHLTLKTTMIFNIHINSYIHRYNKYVLIQVGPLPEKAEIYFAFAFWGNRGKLKIYYKNLTFSMCKMWRNIFQPCWRRNLLWVFKKLSGGFLQYLGCLKVCYAICVNSFEQFLIVFDSYDSHEFIIR